MRNGDLSQLTVEHVVRPRVCSGSCKFFAPEYDHGRKIAGAGLCQKHDSQASVEVGTICTWARDWREISHVERPIAMALHH